MFTSRLSAGAVPIEEIRERDEVCADRPWQTVVWDDPVNLTSYVTYVFQTYFGYPRATAEQLMLKVHREGRAVVATGAKSAMATHCEALHVYGLWATISQES